MSGLVRMQPSWPGPSNTTTFQPRSAPGTPSWKNNSSALESKPPTAMTVGSGPAPDAPGAGRTRYPGSVPRVEGHVDPLDRGVDQGGGVGEAGLAPCTGGVGPAGGPAGVVLGGPVVGGGPQQVVPAADPVAGGEAVPPLGLHPLGQPFERPRPAGGAAVGDLGHHGEALPHGGAPVVGDPHGPDQLVVELVVVEALHPDGTADDIGVFEGHGAHFLGAVPGSGREATAEGHCARSPAYPVPCA